MNWQGKVLTIQPAIEVDDVLAVLDEAAAWLRASGIEQWPERFKPEWIAPAIDRGETWLARLDGVVAGTITLDWDDPLWSGLRAHAGYVHQLAVRRSAAGLGASLLDWATATSQALGCSYLRLDCVSTNRRLRTYYETRGFQHQGDVADRHGPSTGVSLYQLPL